MDNFLSTLSGFGFTDQQVVGTYRAFSGFLLGNLLLEAAVRGAETSPVEEPLDEGNATIPSRDGQIDLSSSPAVAGSGHCSARTGVPRSSRSPSRRCSTGSRWSSRSSRRPGLRPVRPSGPGGYGRAMIRVELVDDDPMVRTGVRAILAAAEDIVVVAEAGDGRQALEQARAHRPDVVLLDIRMPVLDGLDAASALRRELPEVAVVMLTTFSESEYVARALDSGAAGFLLKSGDPYELMAAVRAASGGAAYLSPQIAQRVIQQATGQASRRAAATDRIAALSPREREVLALVGAGLSNAEIGRRLFLVEGTVKAYVSAVLSRLGVRNRVQAAVLAYEAGLVPPVE